MSKSIYEKQNEPLMINCLYAQRRGYTSLKTINLIRYSVSIGITTLFAILLFIRNNKYIEAIATVLNIVIIIADKYLDIFTSKKQKIYAKIQQYFDISCFNKVLEHNLIEVSSIFVPSEIAELTSDDYSQKEKNAVCNWYENYSTLSPIKQVYYSQKENVRWNKRNNTRFFIFNILIFVIAIFFLIFFSIKNNITSLKLIGIISCGLTYFDFSLDIFLKLKKDSHRFSEKEYLIKDIERNLSKMEQNSEYELILKFQNLISEHREECFLIPDLFYHFFRDKDEVKESLIAKQIIGVEE